MIDHEAIAQAERMRAENLAASHAYTASRTDVLSWHHTQYEAEREARRVGGRVEWDGRVTGGRNWGVVREAAPKG